MDETLSDSLIVEEALVVDIQTYRPFYGSLEEAAVYFSNELHGELWGLTAASKQRKALISATGMIDSLKFLGTRGVGPLEFPRDGMDDVPKDIEEACYELALQLIKDVNSQTEYENTFVRSRQFGNVRTDYEYITRAPEYIMAGIPSLLAWRKLYPYIRSDLTIKIRRES